MNADGSVHITERIIGCAIRVSNTLGCGFLEKVYEAALAHELRAVGFDVQQQTPISVFYEGVVVASTGSRRPLELYDFGLVAGLNL